MKRLAAALVLLVTVVGFAPSAAQESADSGPPSHAFAQGGTPTDQVPFCTDVTPEDRGRAEQQRNPDFGPEHPRSRVCRAEPTAVDDTRVTGHARPSHTATQGYHFAFAESDYGDPNSTTRQGVRSKINSVNPNVCHDCGFPEQFVAEWVMATDRRPNREAFIQAGWSERNIDPNTRRVFSYGMQSQTWLFFDQFPLTDGQDNGQSYAVRHTDTGFGWEWTTYLWWNGAWRLLDEEWLDLPPNLGTVSGELTSMIEALEIYAGPGRYHPCVPRHLNTKGQVYTEPFNTWLNWTQSAEPFFQSSLNPPYSIFLPFGTAEAWETGTTGGC